MADKTVLSSGLSSNLYTTNEKPIDMFPSFLENYPGLFPFTTMSTKLSERMTKQSQIDWIEEEEIPRVLSATGVTADGTTETLTSTQYTYVRQYDLLYNTRTGERFWVLATPTTSTISLKRGWGGSTAAAINVGDTIVRFGNAFTERSEVLTPRMVVNNRYYNLTQEISKSTEHSWRTMEEETFFGGPGTKRDEDNRKMLLDSRKELELGFYLGKRSDFNDTTQTPNAYVKTFEGVFGRLQDGSNYKDFGGLLTESSFNYWLTDIYSQFPDTDRITMFMSPKAYSAFNDLFKHQIRVSPNSKEYGFRLDRYFGGLEVDLVKQPAFAIPGLSGTVCLLDMTKVKAVWQKKPVLMLDSVKGKQNATIDKLYGIVSMMLANEGRHGLGVNFI